MKVATTAVEAAASGLFHLRREGGFDARFAARGVAAFLGTIWGCLAPAVIRTSWYVLFRLFFYYLLNNYVRGFM